MRVVSGKYRGKKLKAPPSDITRPTTDRVKESLFNIITNSLGLHFKNMRVLDAFAGSGALGIECLSRGAPHVSFVEGHPSAQKFLKMNLEKVEENYQIFPQDLFQLPPSKSPYDLAFLDPPYGKNMGSRALQFLMEKEWLTTDSLCILESSIENPEELKAPFQLIQERKYGQTLLQFCKGNRL